MDVRVDMEPEDMPGRPLKRIQCEQCGEYVQDIREVHINGKVLCKPCAVGGYYSKT
jgi:formylmethanofuran dehydrogenase subunit E